MKKIPLEAVQRSVNLALAMRQFYEFATNAETSEVLQGAMKVANYDKRISFSVNKFGELHVWMSAEDTPRVPIEVFRTLV